MQNNKKVQKLIEKILPDRSLKIDVLYSFDKKIFVTTVIDTHSLDCINSYPTVSLKSTKIHLQQLGFNDLEIAAFETSFYLIYNTTPNVNKVIVA
jgi:hypothetical protein